MSLPKYSDYRDSGVDWLVEVPSHWRALPLWTLFRRTKRTGHEGEQLLSVYRDFGVIPKASRDDNNNKASDDLSTYQLVEQGDLAINKMKAWQGAVAISEHRGIVSPAYFVYEATHAESSKYLHYLLRSPRYITGYLALSKGIRVNQWDLEPQYHSRMPVLLPPRAEQDVIASFLDRETAKIDALIAEQEKLLALLAEKRRTTISHAVTRGLDSSAPFEDSGVPWLGEVPAHWSVSPLGLNLAEKPCYGVLVPDVDPAGVPMLRIVDIEDGSAERASLNTISPALAQQYERTFVRKGDLVLSVVGTIGETLIVDETLEGVNLSRALARLIPSASTCADWLCLVFQSIVFEEFVNMTCVGTAQRVLNMDDLRALRLPFPPLREQQRIAAVVKDRISKIDELNHEATRAVKLLKERRSALIASAVTGQIDVRSAVET